MARVVQASEAKAHLASLLDEVQRGETIIITRRGQPVARIVPEADRRKQESVRQSRTSSDAVNEPARRSGARNKTRG
jgi:prevent-host-death family protein